jgi:hypothetical protein
MLRGAPDFGFGVLFVTIMKWPIFVRNKPNFGQTGDLAGADCAKQSQTGEAWDTWARSSTGQLRQRVECAKQSQFLDCGLGTDLRRNACPGPCRPGPARPIVRNEPNSSIADCRLRIENRPVAGARPVASRLCKTNPILAWAGPLPGPIAPNKAHSDGGQETASIWWRKSYGGLATRTVPAKQSQFRGAGRLTPRAAGANKANSRRCRVGRGPRGVGRAAKVQNEPNLPPAGILPVARASRPCVARPSWPCLGRRRRARRLRRTRARCPRHEKDHRQEPALSVANGLSAVAMPSISGAMARNKANFRPREGRVQWQDECQRRRL